MNISSEMYLFCLEKQSQVYNSDMKIYLENDNSYIYADCFMIVESKKVAKEYKDAIINPAIIVEVLSKSTEAKDRGEKFRFYTQIPSLRHYVLIEQDKVQIDIYSRKSPTSLWDIRFLSSLENNLELEISETETLTIPLSRIYDRIEFEKE